MLLYQIIRKGISPKFQYYVKISDQSNGLSRIKGESFMTQEEALGYLQKIKTQNENFTRDNVETVVYTDTP